MAVTGPARDRRSSRMTAISPALPILLALAVALSFFFDDALSLSLSRPGRRFTRVHPWEKVLHPVKVIAVALWLWIVAGTDLDRPLVSAISPRLAALTGWIGAVVGVFGIAYACLAKRALGDQFAARLALHETHQLVTKGPYRWTRHPIYTGAILGCWGTVLAFDTVATLIVWGVIFSAVLYLHSVAEESLLVERFGDAYRHYQREVPRLVPLPWRGGSSTGIKAG